MARKISTSATIMPAKTAIPGVHIDSGKIEDSTPSVEDYPREINIGGAVASGTVAGTYTLNQDCTGTKTVYTNVGVTVHEAVIVIGGGQRMIGTQTDPWAVVQTRAEKIGD
jgi:hypothetical protein